MNKCKDKITLIVVWVTIFTLVYLLTANTAYVATRIEILNHRAGNFMTREQLYRFENSTGVGAWRYAIDTEERWRELWLQDVPLEDRQTTRLTEAQAYNMTIDLDRGRRMNALHSYVDWQGMLQYPRVYLLFLVSLAIVCDMWKQKQVALWALPPLLVSIGAGFLMHYRAYFSFVAD